jgi:hypothetical protein
MLILTMVCIHEKNTIVCDLYKNEKMEVPIPVNSTNPNIILSYGHFVIWTFCHFRVVT